MKCEQMKLEQGRKELREQSTDTHDEDVFVDSDNRMKLEQLVKRLQNEVLVRQFCRGFVIFRPPDVGVSEGLKLYC